MAIEIDSPAVIAAAVKARHLFPSAPADAAKLAKALAKKAIKASGASSDGPSKLATALGPDVLRQLLDEMTVPEMKSLIGKLDKHNAEAKTATAGVQRERYLEIAAGADPLPPPAKAAKAPKAAKAAAPKPERGFSSKAAQAKRQD